MAEKKLPYELIEVDLKQKPEDLVRINPYGKVPVLVDDGGVIYESAILNEYLDEKFPANPLLPKDLLKRARVRIWVDYFNTRVHPAGGDLSHDRNVEKAAARMAGYLETLDRELDGRDFLVDEFSLADVTFIPFYTRRARYKTEIGDRYPNVRRWGESLIARPAVAATL